MAEDEKKSVTQTNATNMAEWVVAYWGDDAIDRSKATKLKHIMHTAQFASVAYIVRTNSKSAHIDFFEENYTTVDSRYAKAAELIIRLLHKKYENGKKDLTQDDFDACGGKSLFGSCSKEEYSRICSDYISAGGLVDKAQAVLPQYNEDKNNAKCYGEIIAEMDDVKESHSYLLGIGGEGSKGGTLSREQIFNLYDATTDKATQLWHGLKSDKSGSDFDYKKQMEELHELNRDLAFKTAKIGILGGVGTMALGALAGGLVFVPAVFGIGAYALGKHWFPDFAKSLGAVWGNYEKRRKTKLKARRAANRMDWLMRYVENEDHDPNKNRSLKQIIGDLRDVPPWARAVYKKQAKTLGFFSIELHDGKTHKGEFHKSREAAANLGVYKEGKGTAEPIDLKETLESKLKAINPAKAELGEFLEIATSYLAIDSKLSTDAQRTIDYLFAEKLNAAAKKLIFGTKFEDKDYFNTIKAYFEDEAPIMKVLKKTNRSDDVSKIKKYLTLAGKEVAQFDDDFVKKTLEEYIMRVDKEIVKVANISDYSSKSADCQSIITLIESLKLSSDDKTFETSSGKILTDITAKIAGLSDKNEKTLCNSLLKKQMEALTYNRSREHSRKIYEVITNGSGVGGPITLAEIFEKFKDITYENIHSFSEDVRIGKLKPNEVQNYVLGKLGKQVYDVFTAYANNNSTTFKNDLKALSEYLKKVNSNTYLNEKQKMDLSSNVTGYVKHAFGVSLANLSTTFVQEYDTDFFAKCLQGYEQGGFGEMFMTDQSLETQLLKDSFEYMKDLQDIFKTLKLSDQFDLNKDEAKYIAKTLLTDRSTGEPPKLKTRDNVNEFNKPGSGGELVDFIINKIKVISTSFPNGFTSANLENFISYDSSKPPKVVAKTITSNVQPWKDLKAAWDYIHVMPQNNVYEKYDKYTALLILKNKCISLFRLCMKSYVQSNYTGSPTTWVDNNISNINEIKNAWDPFMKAIDGELSKFSGITKCAGDATTTELGKYGTGEEVVEMYSRQRQL